MEAHPPTSSTIRAYNVTAMNQRRAEPFRHQPGATDHLLELPTLLESRNPAMRRAIVTARQVAASDVTVLLSGESGTGKNALAASIHAWSPRCAGPFVAVRCTTSADDPLDSRLFGRDKPDRFEAARGGTLFLDEVSDLSLELQANLLRVLADRCFERVGTNDSIELDARIIAATGHDLEADVRNGAFREDLFFRLNVVTITVPPLREREEDLPALTDRIVARLAARHQRGTMRVSPAVRRLLAAYSWPGNAGELVNALERAIVLSRGDTITPEHLPDRLLNPHPHRAAAGTPSPSTSLKELERQQIERVIADSRTLEEAAVRLGINSATLWRKRKRYGLG